MNTDEIHSCHPWCERPSCVAVREAVAAEREACARLCEKMETYGDPVQCWLDQCAAAIRTRGEA